MPPWRRAARWWSFQPLMTVLDLRRELIDDIAMSARIDFALQDLRRRADGNLGNIPTQCLARVRSLEIDLLFSRRQQPGAFGSGRALGLFHHVVGAMLRLIDDLGGAFACLAHDDLGTLIGGSQFFRALLAGGESCCDLA